MSEIAAVLAIAGTIISTGFLTSVIFKRTGIPDTLFLILIGITFGPLLKIISPDSLLSLTPVFGALTLALILFQGGLSMRFHSVLSQSLTAATLGFLYIIFATLFVLFFGHIVLGLRWVETLMLGPITAGTSSVIIMPLLSKLSVPDEVKTTLSLESVVTDVLSIILVMTILEVYLQGNINLREAASILASGFAVGILSGALIGLFWVKVLDVIKGQEYVYMLTIAALLLCYSGTEFLGGSGSLSALVFGLILGNYEVVDVLGIRVNKISMQKVLENIKRFQDEIAFLVRSFFLVILGLIYVPLIHGFIIAGIIMVINILLRYLAVRISVRSGLLRKYKEFMTLMCGTGLANATLSLFIYNKMQEVQNPIAYMYPLIVTNTVIINNMITALTPIILRKHLAAKKSDRIIQGEK